MDIDGRFKRELARRKQYAPRPGRATHTGCHSRSSRMYVLEAVGTPACLEHSGFAASRLMMCTGSVAREALPGKPGSVNIYTERV